MNKQKYRQFDYLTNIIISSKVGTYAPYKGGRVPVLKASFKKIDPLHLKFYDRGKKNPKVFSKNDRIDLYLEGNEVPEARKVSSKSLISNDNTFYKVCKSKKKEEIATLEPKLRTNKNWPSLSIYENGKGSEEFHNKSNNQINQIRETNVQGFKEIQRKSTENVKFNKVEVKKQALETEPRRIKYQSVKNQLKKVCHHQSNQKDVIIQNFQKRKPLFYLQPKEISHIKADSFIVTEYPSGQIIIGNYFKKIAEIASLTKIMTFYTVYQIAKQAQKDISKELFQIDEESQAITGTSAQVFVGDIYTIQQLLYGLMLPSGNDAALALAKWGGQLLVQKELMKSQGEFKGEVRTFVQEMNRMAKKLELKSTKFGNPHGLPHNQSGSSAEDLSTLVHECLKIDLFKVVIATKKYSCWIKDNEGVNRQIIWENTNKLLRRPNFIGVKTGVTVTAGPCLATCYKSGQKIFIIILLRTNKLSRRFKETRWILGMALTKLDRLKYGEEIRKVFRVDIELDSDNSEEEDEFNFDKSDAKEMKRRNKILTFEM